MMTFFRSELFFASAVLMIIVISCNKTDTDIIPDVYIDFTIDLLDPEFASLSAIGIADTIDASTNNWGSRSAGYDGNGIIVYCGPDEYYAFDRTCPYDYAINSLSIKVKINYSIARCQHCGTEYALSAYGSPVSGAGKYPLKSYKTSFDGERYVRVWNE